MKKYWYAVYTKSNYERKVTALLSKKKIENYCPYNRIIQPYQGNKRKMEFEPLFPSFVFIYINEAEINLVKKTNFVVDFIYWLGKPAVVKEAEILNMKEFTQQHFNITIEKSVVNMNGNVRVVNESKNVIDSGLLVTNSTIKLQLPSLGFTMVTEIITQNTVAYTLKYEREKLVV